MSAAHSALAFDVHERGGRAAVTDVLAVEVVVRVPVHVLLVAAADQMAARHDALLHAASAATFNTPSSQITVTTVDVISALTRHADPRGGSMGEGRLLPPNEIFGECKMDTWNENLETAYLYT